MAGRDGAPITIPELKDTLYEALRFLEPHSTSHRIKRASLYLTTIDEHGTLSSLCFDHEITLRPYDCAAESFDKPKR